MTVSVTPKTVTITNGTANDGSVVNTMFTDCYTNDSTLASYINSNCALTTGPNSFSSTQTFTATPVSTKGIDLARAAEPTSPPVGEFWYSSVNNQFEGLVQAGTITAATNASPIVVTTSSAHGLGTGQTVYISGVVGNTAANGSFTATVTSSTTFSLGGSTGNGAYTSGGTVSTIQTIKQGSPIASVSAISSDPAANVTDKGKFYVCTSTFTFTLTAAAILGSGWYCYLRNDGTGIITIDPNGSETIDGQTTITAYPGEAFTIVCDGSNFKALGRQRGLVLLQAQTASNVASVAFTNYITSDFDEYVLEYNGVYMGTNATDLWLRVSLDNGSTWKAGASDYKYNDKFSNTGSVFGAVESTADTKIVLARSCTNLSSQPVDGITRFFRPSDTNADKIFLTDNYNFASAELERCLGYGYYLTAASAVTGVEFLSSSGNIYGTFRLYGVRKS